jgi:hypothetical protein
MTRALAALLLTFSASLLTGCAAATVGADVVGSTFDVAKEAVVAGKAETFINIPFEAALESTRRTAEKLDIKFIKEDKKHPDRIKLLFADDRKQEITITIIRRTAAMTEVRVDVGLFGPDDEARLTLREVLKDTGLAAEDRKVEGLSK